MQVLDVIAPPYTSDFVQLFLPILENDSIAGTIRTEGEHDAVAEFIGTFQAVLSNKRRCSSFSTESLRNQTPDSTMAAIPIHFTVVLQPAQTPKKFLTSTLEGA